MSTRFRFHRPKRSRPSIRRSERRTPLARISEKRETITIRLGFVLSVISASVSAYAAWQTAQQAKFAQQALVASDLNHSFSAFHDAWSELCKAINPAAGYLVYDAKLLLDPQRIEITAHDLGYTFAPMPQPEYRMNVISAMDKAVEAQEKLSMWLSKSTLDTMRFEAVLNNLIILSRIDVSQPDVVRYSAMMKEVGYCQAWRHWFMAWFKEAYPPTPDVDYQNVTLVFKGRNGTGFDETYIKQSRSMPWDEIHKYAPP